MTENYWRVFYGDGLKDGVDEESAVQQLAKVMKLSENSARKIIRATNRVIKKGLSEGRAQKYRIALDRVGMKVELQGPAVEPEIEPDDRSEIIESPQSRSPAVMESAKDSAASPPADSMAHVAKVAGDDNFTPVDVEFHGKGFEYFKIWIVNIFLTILSLGIYSAWAKVRNKRYFYGNTQIDGSSFEYTARPITILKGRLIAVGVFIVYSLISQFLPVVGLVLALAFVAIIPWLIVRSLAFNARNSVYRNILFNFTGTTMDALKVFVLWPLLIVPTLGLILPYVWCKQQRFIVSNSAYGTTGFNFEAEALDYYRVFFIALGGLIAVGLVISGLAVLVGSEALVVTTPLSMVAYLVLFGYLTAALGNIYFNFSRLGPHAFVSTLQTGRVAWLYFSNTIAIALTLGLMIPWTQVRMARYRAECLVMEVSGGLDDFVGAEQKQVSALGEEMGDVFDVEISFT